MFKELSEKRMIAIDVGYKKETNKSYFEDNIFNNYFKWDRNKIVLQEQGYNWKYP